MIKLPFIPAYSDHNAHIFHLRCYDKLTRDNLLSYLKIRGIEATFHYIPLHSSEAGMKYGEFRGNDDFTTTESERLLRLPLHTSLNNSEIDFICDEIYKFYQ